MKDILESKVIALVIWGDAESTGGPGWEEAESIYEAATAAICIVHSVGYILNYTDDRIVLCDTIQQDGSSGGSVHLIPKDMIKSVQLLSIEGILNVAAHDHDKF